MKTLTDIDLEGGRGQRLTPEEYHVLTHRLSNAEIPHAFNPIHVRLVKLLTQMQHSQGLYGTVGELGVHNGGFFLAVVAPSHPREPMVAIDLFDDQQDNVDGSGYTKDGNLGAFKYHVSGNHITFDDIALFKGNSMLLQASNFLERNLPTFRFLSVDGGHTLELTLHDLQLASCLVMDGGIVVLDDFANTHWMGVFQAAIIISTAQGRLAPFMWTHNKLYFTTPSHHSAYLTLALAHMPACLQKKKEYHISRRSMGQWEICLGAV